MYMQRVQRPELNIENEEISVSNLIFKESELFKNILSKLNSAKLIQDVRCRLFCSYTKKLNLKSITILEKNV